MIRFSFGMPLWLMGVYGGVMVLVVLALRLLLGKWLPKRVMPVLWALVLVRLLVPFSISSPLSLPVPGFLEDLGGFEMEQTAIAQYRLSDTIALPGTVWSTVEKDSVVPSAIPEEQAMVSVTEDTSDLPGILIDRLWGTGSLSLTELGYGCSSFPSLLGQLGMGFGGIGLVGMGVLALVLCLRYAWGRSRFKGIYPIEENETVRDTLVRCRVNASVCTCDTIQSPVVVGIFRPLILLPASLDFREIGLVRHILTHEAMHIRRRDNLVKLVMMAALCLHWYNPLVWLMAREFCRDMESACDETALSVLGQEESAPYAQSLLSMAVPGLSGGLFASAFSRTEVERRIKSVLAYRKLGALTLAAAAVVVLTSATAFATCGQAPFNDYLGDWCYSGNTYVARAALNRPIDLGPSRNYARSRANAVVMEVLKYNAPDYTGVEALEKMIQQRLGREFQVEPGAFKVLVAPALDPEETAAQYKEQGLVKDDKGRWVMEGKLVHVLEDQMTGEYYSNSEGEVDVYIIRDEQYKLLRIESYLYNRF